MTISVDCDIRKYTFYIDYNILSGNQMLIKLFSMFAKHEMNILVLMSDVPRRLFM